MATPRAPTSDTLLYHGFNGTSQWSGLSRPFLLDSVLVAYDLAHLARPVYEVFDFPSACPARPADLIDVHTGYEVFRIVAQGFDAAFRLTNVKSPRSSTSKANWGNISVEIPESMSRHLSHLGETDRSRTRQCGLRASSSQAVMTRCLR